MTDPAEAANISSASFDRSSTRAAPGAAFAIAAIVLVALGLRPGIVSVGPVIPDIIHHFALSHTSASLLTSIPDLLMGALALPAPWLARRYGRDRVIIAALGAITASIVLRACAGGNGLLFVATAGVGAGIAVAGTLMGGFVKARFPDRAAAMMGIYAGALSLGSTVSAAATGPIAVAQQTGWRFASGVWAVPAIAGLLGWAVLSARSNKVVAASAQSVSHPPIPLGDPKAWLIALFFGCNNLLFYALLAWTAPMNREAGASPLQAGLLLAGFTAAFMVANPMFGVLSRSLDRRGWLTGSAALVVAGLLALVFFQTRASPVAIPLIGFGLGGGFTLGMTLPLDRARSAGEADVWTAFVLTVGYLIAAAGPLAVGALRDALGDFRMALGCLMAVSVVMLALCPLMRPQKAG